MATITNEGPSVLDVAAVELVGPGAGHYNLGIDSCSGAQLPASGSCLVAISGQPADQAAYLAVTDDVATRFRVRLDRDGPVTP